MLKQKSLITLSVFVMSAFAMLATRNFVQAASAKVTICHATSSETVPYVQIVVSENGIGGHFENSGTPKSGHEDDLLFQGEVACPGGTTPTVAPSATPSATQTPTPTIPTQCEENCVTPTITSGVTPTPTEGDDNGNIYDPCVLNRCPSATPTATPTNTPTPTSTPNTGGGSNDSGSNNNSSNNNSSSSTSSNSGSVQGATTTLAATGVFEEMFMNMVGLAGVALSGLSAVMYAKKS